jgi:penicillin-binding protein 1C
MRGGALALDYWRDPVSGLRVLPDCAHSGALEVHTVRWPVLLEPWIDARLLEAARAPRWASACATHADQDVRLHIFGARDGEVIEQLDRNSGVPLKLEARGAQGHVYWIVNGHLTAREASVAAASIGLREAGGYDITALDDAGHYDRIHLRVRPAG